jgi:hypothetical protein
MLRVLAMAAKGQPFDQIVVLAEKPDVRMQGFVTATAGTSGYTMNTAGSNSLVLTRKYLPTWAIIVAIVGALVMLLGLLALLGDAVLVFLRPSLLV